MEPGMQHTLDRFEDLLLERQASAGQTGAGGAA
jgi:hypothetical protein